MVQASIRVPKKHQAKRIWTAKQERKKIRQVPQEPWDGAITEILTEINITKLEAKVLAVNRTLHP